MTVQGPYDVVYQLSSGFLVWFGIPAARVEIYLPFALSALLPCLLSRLTLIHSDARLATLVALATPGWYAVYRIGADLHANLLGLVLMLAALIFVSKANSTRRIYQAGGLILVSVASFTHIETTLFFVMLILITSLTPLATCPFRIAASAGIVTVPATVVYIGHLLDLRAISGTFALYSPSPFVFWLIAFGPLLPLTILGLIVSTSRRRSWLEIFAASWGLAALLIGVSQYVSTETSIFAQRAALLIPTPFLAAVGMLHLQGWASRFKRDFAGLRFSPKQIVAVSFILLALSWPLAYGYSAAVDQRVFLTPSAFQKLQWISNNLKTATSPIFVYNDFDQDAGGYGDLYNNWVSAIVGPHLSYLGLVDYLVQLQETPFFNPVSRTISALFMEQIHDAGITNKYLLLQHPIILVEDFHRLFPLPLYTINLFDKVQEGVFVSNQTKLQGLTSVTVPLYSSLTDEVGLWHPVQRSWAESIYALETERGPPARDIEASLFLRISSTATFALAIRYWDGSGNSMGISLDGRSIGTVVYNNAQRPAIWSQTGILLNEGLHTMTIRIGQNPAIPQYASLDYVNVVRS